MSGEDVESGLDERRAVRADRGDTQRLEAFSDGVFAVAITLLVLNLHVPAPEDLKKVDEPLLGALATQSQWASYLAYAISFSFILIMWINHHELFKLIRRSDHMLLILNGSLLLFVTLVPFSTALLATYVPSNQSLANQRTAAAVYSGLYTLLAICFNGLWRYASGGHRLLDKRVRDRHIRSFTNGYLLGPLLYFVALLLAFISPFASLVLNVALAIFWAVFPLVQRSFIRREDPVTAAMSVENEPAGR